VKCHDGPHFTDASFHNIGVKGEDVGRFKVLDLPILKGAFKTPALRDVELTAPYFHDGSAATLMAVVEHYDRGGDTTENLDKDIHKLGLTAREKEDLVAFLKALTGKPIEVERPRLPHLNKSPRRITTLALMKDVDGMLSNLDKLVPTLDAGQWDQASATIDRLIENTEELAALRSKLVAPERVPLLKRRVGALIVAFSDLATATKHHNRTAAMAAYESVRERCEQCHDDFRTSKKK
jgi:hypothetical protein